MDNYEIRFILGGYISIVERIYLFSGVHGMVLNLVVAISVRGVFFDVSLPVQ